MRTKIGNARVGDSGHQATGTMLSENPLEFIAQVHPRAEATTARMRRITTEKMPAEPNKREAIAFLAGELALSLHDEIATLANEDRQGTITLTQKLQSEVIVELAKLVPLRYKKLTWDGHAMPHGSIVQLRINDMRGARENAH